LFSIRGYEFSCCIFGGQGNQPSIYASDELTDDFQQTKGGFGTHKAAQNAEQTLQNNINTVNSRVDAEQIARANADNALSGAIDTVDDKVDALSGEVQTMGDEAIVNAEYVSSSTA
jgi:hypothetical protein